MKNKIRKSLTIKIFFLTVCMLLLISGATYLCVARFLPVTYSMELSENLNQEVEKLIGEMEKASNQEEGLKILEAFSNAGTVSLFLMDEDGNVIYPAYENFFGEEVVTEVMIQEGEAGEAKAEDVTSVEDSQIMEGAETDVKEYPLVMNGQEYYLQAEGSTREVKQTMEVLRQILPVIILVVAVLACICGGLTSWYLTRPILDISRISRQMAALSFAEKCKENRSDELGVLARSLNQLSSNLYGAMHSLHTANQKLKSDMEQEREAERKRTAFFAAASHELKTPVTVLKGHLGGMMQNVGAYQNREYYLQRSYEVTASMEEMVQEILTTSRIDTETREIKKSVIDISELLREQLAELVELFEEKELTYVVEIPEHLMGKAEEKKLEKVFRNFLTNALRYTPKRGSVRIYLQENQTEILCRIENTGASIPEENQSRIFEAFYRVEESRNRSTGGSGLGLYLVKLILEQHGAEYGVENISDGVRFWFRLKK